MTRALLRLTARAASAEQGVSAIEFAIVAGGTLAPIAETPVRSALSTVIQALAAALPATLEANGVRLGYMDVTATSVRCGLPVLTE